MASNEQLADALNRSSDVLFSLRDINADVSEATRQNTSAITSLTEILKDNPNFSASNVLNNEGSDKDKSTAMSGGKVNFKELAKSLTGFAEALPKMAVGLAKFKKANTEPFINFLDKTIESMSMKGKIKSSAGIERMYKAFAAMFTALGTGIKGMGEGLMIFGIAAKLGQKTFIAFLDKLTQSKIFTLKSDKAKDNAQAFFHIAKGIKSFAIGMALATPLLIIGIPGFILLTGMIMGLSLVSRFIDIKSAKEFAGSMLLMSGALVLTAFSFLITRILEPEDVLKGVGMMLGLGLTMMFIGRAKQFTLEGAFVMLAAAASMVIVAFAIKQVAAIDGTKLIGASVALGALIIAPIVTLGLLGMSGIGWVGVALLGAIGLSFLAISFSLKMLTELNFDKLTKGSDSIWSFAKITMYMGAASPLILAGSYAMGAMGLALIAMGGGLRMMQNLDVNAELGSELYKFFYGTGKDGGVATLFFDLGGPIDTPMIMGGAATGIAIGLALLSIGKGLKEFTSLSIDYKEVGASIGTMITSLTAPFAELGKGGFFMNDTETGIEAIADLGENLANIAKAVQMFSNLEFVDSKGKLYKINDSMMVTVGDNIGKMIAAIATPFGVLGGNAIERLWYWPGTAAIKSGVAAVEGLGDVVAGVADGILKMATFKFTDSKGTIVDLGSNGDAIKAVGNNIGLMIKSIADPLAALGGTERERSWFWPGDTAIKAGIENIQGLGKNVGEIADAVIKIAGMKVDTKGTTSKIISMISSITMPIMALTNKDGIADPFNKGAKIVIDLEEINTNANLLGDIAKNMKPMIESITKVSEMFGKDDKAAYKLNNGITAIALGFNAFGLVNKKVLDMKTKNLEKLSEVVERIAKADPKSFAANAKSFGEFSNGFKTLGDSLAKISENTFNQFNQFIKTLAEVEGKAVNVMDKKIEATKKIAETIAKTPAVQTQSVNVAAAANDAKMKAMEDKMASMEATNQALLAQITSMNNAMRQLVTIMSGTQEVRVVNQTGNRL